MAAAEAKEVAEAVAKEAARQAVEAIAAVNAATDAAAEAVAVGKAVAEAMEVAKAAFEAAMKKVAEALAVANEVMAKAALEAAATEAAAKEVAEAVAVLKAVLEAAAMEEAEAAAVAKAAAEAAEAVAVAKVAVEAAAKEAATAVAVAKTAFEAAAAKGVAVAKALAKEAAEVVAMAKDLVEAAAKEAAEAVAVAKAVAEAAEAVAVPKAALEASMAVAKDLAEAAAKWAAEAKAAAEAAAEAKAAAEAAAVANAVAKAAAEAAAVADAAAKAAAAAAAEDSAAATRTQLGRLALVVVGFAFALGAVWLASAFRIASAVDHCLAVKVHWLADPMCRDTVVFAAPLAVASLILMAAAVHRQVKAEAEAGAQIREAAGVTHDVLPDPELQPPLPPPPQPAVALASGLERRLLLCGSDEVVMLTIISIYLCCVTFILVGMLLRMFGALFLVYYPGDELEIALLMGVGSGFKNVGYLWLAVGHFFLIIPYAVLRLRRFLNQFVSIFVMHVANRVLDQRQYRIADLNAAAFQFVRLLVILSSCRCCHRHCLLLADSPAYCACAKSNCTIAVAFLAMLGMAVCAEVKADAEEEAQIIRVAAGLCRPDVALPAGPDHLGRRGCDAAVVFFISAMYPYCVAFILMGKLLRTIGVFGRVPGGGGDEGITRLMNLGSDFENMGYLWLALGHFFLVAPYAALRLRRFIKEEELVTMHEVEQL
ncbi:hypothetical protein OsJ_27334 [Oryza sativa Japonica Group]|uniref:Uncharacterized protein n=1 Tax=Oryza sativa subsp. japonica TaxID=39947 RepID=A3BT66_ORYSJ|nr:hypothetical protein OsJ_27334 [Oryza sativa Japonica Group]